MNKHQSWLTVTNGVPCLFPLFQRPKPKKAVQPAGGANNTTHGTCTDRLPQICTETLPPPPPCAPSDRRCPAGQAQYRAAAAAKKAKAISYRTWPDMVLPFCGGPTSPVQHQYAASRADQQYGQSKHAQAKGPHLLRQLSATMLIHLQRIPNLQKHSRSVPASG
jgi:hypothetical protein